MYIGETGDAWIPVHNCRAEGEKRKKRYIIMIFMIQLRVYDQMQKIINVYSDNLHTN